MVPIVVGLGGGTASGKTTVCRKIGAYFSPGQVCILDQDSYYRDLSDTPIEERRLFNFDHPAAFDIDLLVEHLDSLRNGKAIEKPIYSYATHSRTSETKRVEPSAIVILEGILVLDSKPLRERMDVKIFVDTDDDIRFIRRLRRDLNERGRDLENVIDQYQRSVRPMHFGFVLPSKRYADILIPRGGENDVAIAMVVSALRDKLRMDEEEARPPTDS